MNITLTNLGKMEKKDLLSNEDLLTSNDDAKKLIIYNDEINTVDWVIECIIEVLDYNLIQAEQITMLVHFKGKAIAKSGTFDSLNKFKSKLQNRGLSVTIE